MLSRTFLHPEFVSASKFILISTHLQDIFVSCYCCSVTKQCQSLCNPMDCTTSGFPFFNYPRVCLNSCLLSQWCHSTNSSSVTPFSSCLPSFPASGSFPVSWLFASGGRSIRASASVSVLLMNIQDLFPLGLTGLISLLSKGLSRVFCNTNKEQWLGLYNSATGMYWSSPYSILAHTSTQAWHIPESSQVTDCDDSGVNTINQSITVPDLQKKNNGVEGRVSGIKKGNEEEGKK